jgi:hypothetical protein
MASPLRQAISRTGSAYSGTIDDPLLQRAQWFSFLDGGDLRAGCADGAFDRYRLVFNARYEEQVRIYELTADGAGGAYLVARAKGPANLAEVSSDDLLAPWRWHRSEARLDAAAFAELGAILLADGLKDPAPVGLRLRSDRYYWVAGACIAGQWHYGAWQYPEAGFVALSFPAWLFARDQTGLAVNEAKAIPGYYGVGAPAVRQDADYDPPFILTVDAIGIGGTH